VLVPGVTSECKKSPIDLAGAHTDELVVGRVVSDGDNTGLLGDSLGSPGEVTGVETETTELAVSSTGADNVDTYNM
jgi:hypothetical protein